MKAVQIIGIALLIFILAPRANAHPPTDIELKFDEETLSLTVSVSHMVGKITKHYINKIVIILNDEEIITQKFNVQGSEAKQEVSYVIPGAQNGDRFSVTAYCNISGKKTKTLTVEKEIQNE